METGPKSSRRPESEAPGAHKQANRQAEAGGNWITRGMWYSPSNYKYMWNALVFSLAWGRVVTSRLKSGPSGIYHTHWYTVYSTVQRVGTYVYPEMCYCVSSRTSSKRDQKKLIVPNCYIIPVIVSTLEQTRPRARELADWKESMSAGLPSSRPTTSFKILEWIQQFLEWV